MVLNAMRSHSRAQPSWSKAFTEPLQEFPLSPLSVMEGKLPPDLRGSLYRNGPSVFERKGEQICHWFDGDGAVLGVHFDGIGATGTYRVVNTIGYQAEKISGKFQFGGYGRPLPGPFWRAPANKNAANTAVLATSDHLLALWEGGQPHALDLNTLETLGLDNLKGLTKGQTFSAHPKVDPHSGESYNFGLTFGPKPQLKLYRCDRAGQLQQQGQIDLDRIPMIHDFVLAGPYLIFFIAPISFNPIPVLLHWKSYGDALKWTPKNGTQVLVVDRETLALVAKNETEPWFQWHFGNGFVDHNGQIVVDMVRYSDFQTNQFLKEVPSGCPQTAAPSQLWRLCVNPQTAQVKEANSLGDRTCEFPVVNPREVGQVSRFTYMAVRSDRAAVTDLFDAIACYDHEHQDMILADLGTYRYPSEPLFAPNPNSVDQGWILTVVYDGEQHKSEVWVFESHALQKGPICRLELPQVIPFSFHGTWRSAE